MKLNKVCFLRSKQKILDQLHAEWPDAGLVVLLGANGAGKSSLLNILAGVDVPDSGQVLMRPNLTKFLMPEPAKFYPNLTVSEQLALVAHISNQQMTKATMQALLSDWQLTAMADKLTQHLSLGYRQRLSLAQLELSAADVLLMDEPMNGMDPKVMSVFKEKIMDWKTDKSIIMATHILHEAESMADWVVVMEQGRIIHSAENDQTQSFHEIYQQAIAAYHQQLTEAECQ